MSTSKRFHFAFATIVALSFPLAALAQAPAKPADSNKPAEPAKPTEAAKPAADLPPAKDIIERAIKESGGREAMEKTKNRHVKGTFAIPSMNMKGTMEMFARQPGTARMVAEIGGLGKIERGTDGKTAWEVGPTGPRVLEGDELNDFVRSSDMLAELNTDKYYKIKTVGTEKVGDSDAYKIEMTDLKNDKNVVVQYYDIKSGLLVRRTETMRTQSGEIPSDTSFEKYTKYGDLLAPAVTRQKITGMGQTMEQVITIESVDYPAEFKDDVFAAPDDIKALMNKPKPAGEKPAEPAKKDEPAKPAKP